MPIFSSVTGTYATRKKTKSHSVTYTEDPYWANVSLLLHADTGTFGPIYDSTGKNSVSGVGASRGYPVHVTTAQSKFGGSSLSFDGTDDYLGIPASSNFSFGAGDFTIEAWLYPGSYPAAGSWSTIYSQWTAGDGQRQAGEWIIKMNSAGSVYVDIATSASAYVTADSGTGTLLLNTWTHLAVTKSGDAIKIFINGIRVSNQSFNLSTVGVETLPVWFGQQQSNNSYLWTGLMDEIRVTKGVARYTVNFTPPTAAFPQPYRPLGEIFDGLCNYLTSYVSEFRNPSFYSYILDGNAFYINDGGGDMYDVGNFTLPWLLSGTSYAALRTNPGVTTLSYATTTPTIFDTNFMYRSLGYSSSQLPLTLLGYRTASNTPIGFQKCGNSGADGGGTLASGLIYNGDTVNTFTVYAFYRETYNASDPSHCDLYMLIGHPNWASSFGTINTYADPVSPGGNGGHLYATNSSDVLAVTMLLSKPSPGALVTAAECQTVVQAFTARIKQYLQIS